MPVQSRENRIRRWTALAAILMVGVILTQAAIVWAGCFRFRNNAVGGVFIDPSGFVREPDVKSLPDIVDRMRADVKAVPKGMKDTVPLRMISLRQIEQAIKDSGAQSVVELPDEIRYLSGIQRLKYVFLFPEQNDIVLAGPGEGWRVDDKATVVGDTTGKPVLLLDDLLVAFRSAKNAGVGAGISCSIDPSEDGVRRFLEYRNKAGTIERFNQDAAANAMGPQHITLTGVPEDSHFARVMVASDFRMKRYAMHLEEAPIKGLPSFVELLKQKRGRLDNANPRWWLACNYEPLARSEDGLAWEIRGPGVKVMTEDDIRAGDGAAKGTGKKNPIAQEWAELMTDKYDELSREDPVFAELRNLMDLCVAAALIEKQGMLEKVGLELPLLAGSDSHLDFDRWNAPKHVSTSCSTMKVGREWIITASGGVDIDSWAVSEKSEINAIVERVRETAKINSGKQWWWN